MLAQSKRRKSFLSIKSTTMGHLGAKGTGLLGLSAFCIGEKNKKGLWVHQLSVLSIFIFFVFYPPLKERQLTTSRAFVTT
jgi:hypothetical protein